MPGQQVCQSSEGCLSRAFAAMLVHPYIVAVMTSQPMIQAWKFRDKSKIIGVVQDRKQRHVEQGLRILIQHLSNPESLLAMIRTKVQNRPPVLCLFEYGSRSKNPMIAVVDKVHAPNKIFVNIRLAEALEAADGEHEIRLRFILFATLFHELAHWVTGMLFGGGRISDVNMRYNDWHGIAVGDRRTKEEHGEAGYALEGHLFGGVLCWGRRSTHTRGRSTTLVHTPKRHWSEADIDLIFIHRGRIDDKTRYIISSIESLSSRMNRNALLTRFTDAEIQKARVL